MCRFMGFTESISSMHTGLAKINIYKMVYSKLWHQVTAIPKTTVAAEINCITTMCL